MASSRCAGCNIDINSTTCTTEVGLCDGCNAVLWASPCADRQFTWVKRDFDLPPMPVVSIIPELAEKPLPVEETLSSMLDGTSLQDTIIGIQADLAKLLASVQRYEAHHNRTKHNHAS